MCTCPVIDVFAKPQQYTVACTIYLVTFYLSTAHENSAVMFYQCMTGGGFVNETKVTYGIHTSVSGLMYPCESVRDC